MPITSPSCSGTCLIFSTPRQAKVRRRTRRSGAAVLGRPSAMHALLLCRDGVVPVIVPPRCVGVVVGRAAGQREEHLVEARLAERESVDAMPRAPAGQRGGHLAGSGDARPRALRGRARAAGACRAPRRAAARPRRAGRGRARRTRRARPDRRLQLAGGALRDDPAVVDHGDPVGELVGLVEVLRGEQDRRARGDEGAHDLPYLVAAARVQAGRRLVEEQQLGRDDDAGRDVQPASHPARVRPHRPARGVGEVERLQQLLGPRLGAAAA